MCTTKYLRSNEKMIMQNKFRFSIGYLFNAPELEGTRFPFFLLVISKLRIKKQEFCIYKSAALALY